MKKSNFLIFVLILLGLLKNASLEESKVNNQLMGNFNLARSARSPRRLTQARNSAAVRDDIDEGFQQLTEVIEILEENVSELKSGTHSTLSALSDQLANQKEEIKEIKSAQNQISKAVTLMMETLTKLDIKMDKEFAKSTRNHIQLVNVQTTSNNTGSWYWLMNSFPPIADEVVTDRYEGKSLVLFKTLRLTWAEANAKCEMHGMELVSFDSEMELSYLEALLRSIIKVSLFQPEQSEIRDTRRAYAWVAASDLKSEGDFTWNSGKPFSSSYFGRGEPNNYLQREHCVDIGFEPSYNERKFFANDNRCEITLPVLCQKSAA